MIELPLGLIRALESGDCVLFLGAGIGDHLFDGDENPAPDANSLAKELASYFGIETEGMYDLAKIAQIVEIRKGRKDLETYLRDRLANLGPDEAFQWLSSLRWRAIYTTNYDAGIERAYEKTADPPQKPITITVTSDLVSYNSIFEVPIYHLHGALFAAGKPAIVITEDDYARYKERRKMLFELLKNDFATSTILYIGYSNRDPNWKNVLSEITYEFYPSQLPSSYRVAPDTNLMDIEILKGKNINTISASYRDFFESASTALADFKVDPNLLSKIRSGIPSDLLPAFDKSPAAVTRLISSWTYVNQAPFEEIPNTRAFLRGDQANWALIAEKRYFERDIEEELYEDALDYITSVGASPRVRIILAPAGYGITTLMMIIAVRLVKENAGPIFMHKPGRALLEGDIEFASSLFQNKPVFFVNNSADHAAVLRNVINLLQQEKKSALFVLGERLNEWRQCQVRISAREFQLEALSDPEIIRLLDCLSAEGELGVLEPLSRKFQIAAIKSKHGKQLLVAMREATEGESFDAILENEYRGIADNTSRALYLTVCCFHQHGAYLRDTLMAQLLGAPLPEIYRKTSDPTEGVVIHDCLDESKGVYGLRTRHRTIAAVVWERCGDIIEKEQLLQGSLSAINLNHKTDKDAFEYFYRSDRLVDSIRTLDGRVRFFETACKKDPDSPYVRQHYARMLLRAGQYELALNQIDAALRINPRARILHHTKGNILAHLSLTIESDDIARRRLAQSEASFRKAMYASPKDEYSYQGLASLYIGWAKRAPTAEEATEYISKAEEVINEGLRIVNVRYSLWIESSRIQEWLGDQPSRIEDLERAVRDTPESLIARYILGRAYRITKRPAKTLEVLAPIVREHPNEFRCCVEYAHALINLGKRYEEGIAVLKLSTLYGYSDPRFIAMLGGLLFLDNEFSEADRVFGESAKRDFTAMELNSIQFRPSNPDNLEEPLRIEGVVVVVKAGYALVDSSGYPRLLLPGSKFGGLVLKPGVKGTFELGFSARGPRLDKPVISN